MAEITVYTTPGCVQCRPTKATLGKMGVPFREIDLALPENEETADWIRSLGYSQAPVVMTSFGDEWTGFRPDLLEAFAARVKAEAGE
ncbi:glutaredoxin domain-containing protein [Arthrobacter sp. B2a2-09]|uniref:glutaredoxin domain-containing protein n=1 Tax=Arthrobacter sp. B2a2-09 TaxID=2952822 RepID=UPI0022CD3C36|nr:glutaredoxin domain-containing protein [Arthrobacter sp. B2a2-09]MCZ9884621.1 NrdH-redoxin [Arthrobacter sp. B2a2-09]